MAFDELAYPGHPYAIPDDGSPATIGAIIQEDLAAFHRQHFGPQQMMIAVVGGIPVEQAVELADEHFGDWENPDQTAEPELPALPSLDGSREKRLPLPGKSQSDLVLGVPGPARRDPVYLSALMGNSVLGQFGMYGRIGDAVREAAGLAYYSYSTLGGGLVVDPQPRRKHRRRDPETLARLETLLRGTPAEVLLQAIDSLGFATLADAVAKSGLDSSASEEAVVELIANGDLIPLDSAPPNFRRPIPPHTLITSHATVNRLTRATTDLLAAFHAANPLRHGLPREELKSKLKLAPKVFNAFAAFTVAQGSVAESGAYVRLPTHEVKLTPAQQTSVNTLLATFRRDPHNTPSVKEAAVAVGDDVLAVLNDRGDLVQVSPEVLFLRETYDAMAKAVRDHLLANRAVTVAQARDMFNTSRKYALAFLEYLDSAGVTVRRGDERVLK